MPMPQRMSLPRRFALGSAVAACVVVVLTVGWVDPQSAQPMGEAVPTPLGLPTLAMGTDARRERLGEQLFFDKRLSADGAMACATCHDPAQAFTQRDRATPTGQSGRPLRRNAPTLLNVAFARPLMHDGAAPSLEAQVLTPLLDRAEMANTSFADLEQRLAALSEYGTAFEAVFQGPPTMARIGEALAAYQRTLLSGNSAFDRWKYGGDQAAMSADAKAGFELFTGKAGCVMCHVVGETSALFTDNGMHNTGIGAAHAGRVARQDAATIDFAAAGDRGRQEVTGQPADLYRYRTPTLRNVALTAPYMHDGSIASLEEVVRFYDRGGIANANLDAAIRPLGLNDAEVAALVAFLQSLNGDNVETLARSAPRP